MRSLETILEIRNSHISLISKSITYRFFKDFTNYRKKANRVVVFSRKPLLNILKYRNNGCDLPTIMIHHTYVENVSQYVGMFFRTKTGIHWKPNTFLRLVLKEKAGKEILDSSREEFLEKFSANNFALSDATTQDHYKEEALVQVSKKFR